MCEGGATTLSVIFQTWVSVARLETLLRHIVNTDDVSKLH